MEDTLKQFINDQREALDAAEPSDLWPKISMQLFPASAIQAGKASPKWLKGIFLSSVTAFIIVSAWIINDKDPAPSTPQSVETKTENTDPHVKEALIVKEELTTSAQKNFKPETSSEKEMLSENTRPALVLPETENALPEISSAFVPNTVLSPTIVTDTISDKGDSLFTGIKRIEIDGDFFDVNVKTHNQNSVLFHKESTISAKGLHSKIHQYKVIAVKKDSVLRIFIECDGNQNIFIVGNLIISGQMDLTVPEGVEMQIRNSSGNSKVEGLKGQLDIKTSSGDILADNIISNIKFKSVSGDIKSKNCTGNIQIKSSSGNQLVENVTGNIETESVSGDLTYTKINGNIKITSSSGNQTLNGVTGAIHSVSISGDIKVNDCNGELSLKTSSGDVRGNNIFLQKTANIESISGDIFMDLKNDVKELSFDLKTISGDLFVQNGTETLINEKRLLLNQGPIKISVSTSSGNQTFK
jgi:hypothetical protein